MMAPWWLLAGARLVQDLHQPRPGPAQRDRPGGGVAVCVLGVGQDVAERDPLAGHGGQHGDKGRVRGRGGTDDSAARRANSGTGGPLSCRAMMAAEK